MYFLFYPFRLVSRFIKSILRSPKAFLRASKEKPYKTYGVFLLLSPLILAFPPLMLLALPSMYYCIADLLKRLFGFGVSFRRNRIQLAGIKANSKLATLRAEHRQELDSVKRSYEDRINQTHGHHKHSLEQIKHDFELLNQQKTQEVEQEKLKAKHLKEMSTLKQSFDHQINQMKRNYESTLAELTRELDAIAAQRTTQSKQDQTATLETILGTIKEMS